MKKTINLFAISLIITLSVFFGSCNRNGSSLNQNAIDDYSDSISIDTTVVSILAKNEVEQSQSKDFVYGGATYSGYESHDNKSLFGDDIGQMLHWETTYSIQCFNDGTMTWSSQTKKNGVDSYKHKYEGEWKKNTGSKHDIEYTWYEFWADTYDIYLNKHHSMVGIIDNEGNLFDGPVLGYNNAIDIITKEPTCQVKTSN